MARSRFWNYCGPLSGATRCASVRHPDYVLRVLECNISVIVRSWNSWWCGRSEVLDPHKDFIRLWYTREFRRVAGGLLGGYRRLRGSSRLRANRLYDRMHNQVKSGILSCQDSGVIGHKGYGNAINGRVNNSS
jgi:hypothetical protein